MPTGFNPYAIPSVPNLPSIPLPKVDPNAGMTALLAVQKAIAQQQAMAARAARGGGGGAVATNPKYTNYIDLPDGKGGFETVPVVGADKEGREARAKQLWNQRLQQLAAQDESFAKSQANIGKLSVRGQRAELDKMRQQDLPRLFKQWNLPQNMQRDAVKLFTSDVEANIKTQQDAINDTGFFQSMGDSLKLGYYGVRDAIRSIGSTPEEKFVMDQQRRAERKAVLDSNPHLREEELRRAEGNDKWTDFGENFFLNIAEAAGDVVGGVAPLMAGQAGGAALAGAALRAIPTPVTQGLATAIQLGGAALGGGAIGAAMGPIELRDRLAAEVENGNLSRQQAIEAIEKGELPAQIIGGITGGIPLGVAQTGIPLISKSANTMLGRRYIQNTAEKAAAERLATTAAPTVAQSQIDAAAKITGQNAVSDAIAAQASKGFGRRWAEAIVPTAIDLGTLSALNTMGQNYAYGVGTGQDVPITQGAGQSFLSGAVMGPLFGALNARRPYVPARQEIPAFPTISLELPPGTATKSSSGSPKPQAPAGENPRPQQPTGPQGGGGVFVDVQSRQQTTQQKQQANEAAPVGVGRDESGFYQWPGGVDPWTGYTGKRGFSAAGTDVVNNIAKRYAGTGNKSALRVKNDISDALSRGEITLDDVMRVADTYAQTDPLMYSNLRRAADDYLTQWRHAEHARTAQQQAQTSSNTNVAPQQPKPSPNSKQAKQAAQNVVQNISPEVQEAQLKNIFYQMLYNEEISPAAMRMISKRSGLTPAQQAWAEEAIQNFSRYAPKIRKQLEDTYARKQQELVGIGGTAPALGRDGQLGERRADQPNPVSDRAATTDSETAPANPADTNIERAVGRDTAVEGGGDAGAPTQNPRPTETSPRAASSETGQPTEPTNRESGGGQLTEQPTQPDTGQRSLEPETSAGPRSDGNPEPVGRNQPDNVNPVRESIARDVENQQATTREIFGEGGTRLSEVEENFIGDIVEIGDKMTAGETVSKATATQFRDTAREYLENGGDLHDMRNTIRSMTPNAEARKFLEKQLDNVRRSAQRRKTKAEQVAEENAKDAARAGRQLGLDTTEKGQENITVNEARERVINNPNCGL